MATELPLESPWIEAEVVEISELPDLARRLGVTSVPHLRVEDRVLVGPQSEEAIVEAVLGTSA